MSKLEKKGSIEEIQYYEEREIDWKIPIFPQSLKMQSSKVDIFILQIPRDIFKFLKDRSVNLGSQFFALPTQSLGKFQ